MANARTDRRIEQAVEAGQKNQRTKELIENWCSHARVVKFGGTGIVELETGLPIGHHSLKCDYAEAGGMATWYLADAALDFHDRNCVNCKHRAAVRLPNLTELLKARDDSRKLKQVEEEKWANEAAAALAARQADRQALRQTKLDALSAGVVDHLETLDRDRNKESRDALLYTAKLAPEVFTPPLIGYCFALLESRERWFDDTGLTLLQQLKADPARLTRCALLCLGEHSAVNLAAAIVEANLDQVDESLVEKALPALVLLAHPRHTPFMSELRHPVPDPLNSLYQKHANLVEAGIERLFAQNKVSALQVACSAIIVLSERDSSIAARFTRSVAAKLARSHRLEDEEAFSDEIDEVVHDLRRALAKAISQAPTESDALIEKFLEGASGEGQARLYSAYREVLHIDWRERKQVALTPAHTVAIKRLISAATTSQEEEVVHELQSAFNTRPDALVLLARQEIEHLLGAALLLDDRLQAHDPEPATIDNPLSTLEKWSQRNAVYYLQSNLIKWAAEGAAGDRAASERYMDLLSRVPAERDAARAQLLEGAAPLLETPDGLAIGLPTLYSAMVGTSTRMRAAGATLLNEMRSSRVNDLPELVLEALVMQLSDPYVIVHRSAVKALESIELPEGLAHQAKLALWMLIKVYANDEKAEEFLFNCIQVFSNRYATETQLQGKAGSYFIGLMRKMAPHVVSREIGFMNKSLCINPDFVPLLLNLAKHRDTSEHDDERIFRVMNKLPAHVVHARRSEFEAAAMTVSGSKYLAFIEVLTRSGAWQEAARVADAVYAKIPETNWARPRRLAVRLEQIATRLEAAIASGRLEAVRDLASEWRNACAEIEQDRVNNEEHRNPLRGILGSR